MASGSSSSSSTVYIGNLDERVSERVLYDILIQAGRVVDLHVPRDKELDKPKGFAFAEYESPEIADYAVKLFSGLLTLHHRTLKFAISGQDKQSNATASTPPSNAFHKPRTQNSPPSSRFLSHTPNQHQGYGPPGLNIHGNGVNNLEHSRRVFGSTPDFVDRSKSRRYDPRDPVSYSPY